MQITTSPLRSGFISRVLITSIVALCGCGEKPNANQSSAVPFAPEKQPADASPAAADLRELPPSNAEAQQFSRSFEKTLTSGNTSAINATINFDALMRRAMLDIDLQEDVRQNIVSSANAHLIGPEGIASGLVNAVAKGDRFRLLHVRRWGEEQRALFRRLTSSGGIDYVDVILLRDADGKVRIGDLYKYTNGELESDDMHQQSLCYAVMMNPKLLPTLSPIDATYVRQFSMVREMGNLLLAARFREALDNYQGMPELLKNHRHSLQLRVRACCRVEGQFDEALRAYRAAVPADPGIDVYLLDYYLLHQQFDDLLACVDRLDRAVSGDPALDAYRVPVHLQQGKLAEAKKCAQNAATAEPEWSFARDVLEMVSLAETNMPADRTAGANSSEPSPSGSAGDAKVLLSENTRPAKANATVAKASQADAVNLRTWTDATGSYKIDATFGGMIAGKVKLVKSDGSTVHIPLEKLSDEDREWIKKRSR